MKIINLLSATIVSAFYASIAFGFYSSDHSNFSPRDPSLYSTDVFYQARIYANTTYMPSPPFGIKDRMYGINSVRSDPPTEIIIPSRPPYNFNRR